MSSSNTSGDDGRLHGQRSFWGHGAHYAAEIRYRSCHVQQHFPDDDDRHSWDGPDAGVGYGIFTVNQRGGSIFEHKFVSLHLAWILHYETRNTLLQS